ncbi:hypothetical protein KbCgl_23320 [Corynebacterium glutamicum]|nr:hypothetical protein KbCgl_23320 [Corynebacterium glutamicum]
MPAGCARLKRNTYNDQAKGKLDATVEADKNVGGPQWVRSCGVVANRDTANPQTSHAHPKPHGNFLE